MTQQKQSMGQFKCQECGATFATEAELHRHERDCVGAGEPAGRAGSGRKDQSGPGGPGRPM